jgi:hypothetical protein
MMPGGSSTINLYTTKFSTVSLMVVDQRALAHGTDFDLKKSAVFDDLELYSKIDRVFDDDVEKDTELFYIPDSYEKKFSVSTSVVFLRD